jgi:hypothetical protein
MTMSELSERCLTCPDPDASVIERFQVDFGLPCYMTQRQQRALHEAVDDIVMSPWNQPKAGVHWPAGSGAMPRWSKVDAMMLGKETDAAAPDAGEPTFDDTVHYIECCARTFVSDDERKRVEKRRSKQWIAHTCPDCGPTHVAVDAFDGGKPAAGMCLKCEETLYFA